MGMLQGRKILVTGLLSSRSIAYGIARALAREGATLAFTYQTEEVHVRVADLAKEFGAVPVLPCDVARDEDIEVLFGRLAGEWEGLDGIVHSIAFAPREVLKGELLDNLTRDAFRIAHDVSSYSFAALAKAGLPMMQGRPAALLTLTYLGAARSVPSYNVMGMAKASLEASVRYLALGLGPRGIRVNGISAGPVKTLAAAGISGFGRILKFVEENAPLRRNVTIEEIGNAAAFLMSDLAAGVTGEILHVDAGFNTTIGGMRPEG
ncbi:MAG TPA: SDR family oxidoreductase [Burkholderiales bacterium]|nr:SDR family oxidoreductase [Burkholderiales bacterium]